MHFRSGFNLLIAKKLGAPLKGLGKDLYRHLSIKEKNRSVALIDLS